MEVCYQKSLRTKRGNVQISKNKNIEDLNRFMAGKGIQCPLNTKLPTKNKVNSRPKFLKKKNKFTSALPSLLCNAVKVFLKKKKHLTQSRCFLYCPQLNNMVHNIKIEFEIFN